MVEQVLDALKLYPSGVYVDGTLGGAGHAEAILKGSAPNGRLLGCDRDAVAIRAGLQRLKPFTGRFDVRHGAFRELGSWVAAQSCDGALLDLGVSSPQLDEAGRGFSFQQDGPLDMRMDDRQSLTAEQLVNLTDGEELSRLFWEFGGEAQASRFARAIVRERAKQPIRRTGELAALIERLAPRRGARTHPATRVFQALRMAVNDELGNLAAGLDVVWNLLKPGGRLAVLTFHSLEDQMVKRFGRNKVRDYTFPGEVDVPELRQPRIAEARWVYRKAQKPQAGELEDNPRSRSAQLRVLEKA